MADGSGGCSRVGMNGELKRARGCNEARELKPPRREYKLASGCAPGLGRRAARRALDLTGSRISCVRTDGRRASGWRGFRIASTFQGRAMPTRGRDMTVLGLTG